MFIAFKRFSVTYTINGPNKPNKFQTEFWALFLASSALYVPFHRYPHECGTC